MRGFAVWLSAALAAGLPAGSFADAPKLPWATMEQLGKDAEDKAVMVCPPSTPVSLVPLKSGHHVYAMWVSGITRWLIGEFDDETPGRHPRWVWYGEFKEDQLVVKGGPEAFDPALHTSRWLCGWLKGSDDS